MADAIQCAICLKQVDRHRSYVARIDLFADPTSEAIDTQSESTVDAEDTFQAILDELAKMSPDDAMDDVHRRFEFHLCRACQRTMLANPLGLPRTLSRMWDGPN